MVVLVVGDMRIRDACGGNMCTHSIKFCKFTGMHCIYSIIMGTIPGMTLLSG